MRWTRIQIAYACAILVADRVDGAVGDRLDAVGMNLDMIADSFELLHDVQAYYEVD